MGWHRRKAKVPRYSNACGKFSYRSEKQARAKAFERENQTGKALRVYFCEKCFSYHLTSQPDRSNNAT